MIKLAIASDSLSRYMAMHQLVYILLDFEKYDEAIQFAKKIVEKYPDSQFMWWANAHAYYKKGDYQAAKSSYLTLYDLIIKDNKRNISHLIKCKFKLAVIHKELNEYEACQKQCNSILELSDKVELNDNSEDIVTRTTELMEDCENQMRVTNP